MRLFRSLRSEKAPGKIMDLLHCEIPYPLSGLEVVRKGPFGRNTKNLRNCAGLFIGMEEWR